MANDVMCKNQINSSIFIHMFKVLHTFTHILLNVHFMIRTHYYFSNMIQWLKASKKIHTKSQIHWPSDSGEAIVIGIFTIFAYGHHAFSSNHHDAPQVALTLN